MSKRKLPGMSHKKAKWIAARQFTLPSRSGVYLEGGDGIVITILLQTSTKPTTHQVYVSCPPNRKSIIL